MKVKCIDNNNALDLDVGKVYNVISVEMGMYRVIDASKEDYLYPRELFEIVEK